MKAHVLAEGSDTTAVVRTKPAKDRLQAVDQNVSE